jgi:serine phosphatase RsbU (regulator of sigma subunit)
MRRFIFIVFLLLTTKYGFVQQTRIGSSFITNYSPTDYSAGNQNWAIIQNDNGILYFGNNEGILQFDGKNWQKIDPAYIVSAEKSSDGTIFMGGRENLGFLKSEANGRVKFKSLTHLITDTTYSILYIRHIVFHNNEVWFSDENGHLLQYNNHKIKVKKIANWIGLFKKQNDTIYVQTKEGLGFYKNGQIHMLPNGAIFANKSLQNIHRLNGQTIITTRTDGIFYKTAQGFKKWKTFDDDFIKKSQVYATTHNNNQLILGTVESGVIVLNQNGDQILHTNEESGMINHDHCSIFVDQEGNIWSGLEFGISQIHFNSPFSYFNEASGLNNSAIYSLAHFNNQLFVGTARGLYQSKWNPQNEKAAFNIIHGNSGRKLWDMINIADKLISSSSNIGMHEIIENHAKAIPNSPNINEIIQTEYKNTVIGIGEHSGMYTIEFRKAAEPIITIHDNVPILKRAYYAGNNQIIGLKHNNEVYGYTFNDDYSKIIEKTHFKTIKTLTKRTHKSLFKLNNQILTSSDYSIYIINTRKNKLEKHPILNEHKDLHIFNTKRDNTGHWWFVGNKSKHPVIGKISIDGEITDVEALDFNDLALKDNLAFLPIDSSQILIGTSNRLVVYNSNQHKTHTNKSKLILRYVILNNTIDSLNTKTDKSPPIKIKYQDNAITFKYAYINYEKVRSIQYRYKLEGFDKSMSAFSPKSEKEYSFLPEGDYNFIVKAYVSEKLVDEINYTFKIQPPWYRTIWAYLSYAFIAISIIILIRYLSIKKVEKENTKLENEVQKRTHEILRKNNQLEMQKEELSVQRDEISIQQQKILDSIEYARHIQRALLPEKKLFKQYFNDSFILFKPKDIVSGDFYWLKKINNHLLFTVADCTGHGVPGAFMSIMGISFLNEIVRRTEITSPNMVLEELNKQVKQSLSPPDLYENGDDEIERYLKSEVKDGIELAFVDIDKKTNTLHYSGAESPIYLVRKNEIIVFEGTKIPIGIHYKNIPFELQSIDLIPGDRIYLFTDGYKDQFSSKTQTKFSTEQFKSIILENHENPFDNQCEILSEALNDWKGNSDQIDDITILGIKI